MSVTAQLAEDLILIGVALTWARWSKLDMGFRAPIVRWVWPWSLLFIVWIVLEETAASFVPPIAAEPELQQQLEQLSLAEDLMLTVVISPVKEELLFRGALLAALTRRWGLAIAVVVSSILWALLHFQYEPWKIASIAVSGLLLAIIRWRGGSLYVPIALHIAANLLDLLLANY